MGARYLLDTNICIYALSGRHPQLVKRIDALAPGEAVLSVVVRGELAYGIAKSRRRKDAELRLEALENLIAVVPMPVEAGDHYGEIRAQLEAAGTPIGANDLWIAAHACCEGLVLVTNNAREFRRVKGLKVENWA
ncbi:MAG TPA: type II toxin-antitoxin system VapC family toxin [Rhodanobacteraceae bacterium]|nr:type II toxin-antitoxin system VapC family toxin [Rhodanobacteraceae bacterium]